MSLTMSQTPSLNARDRMARRRPAWVVWGVLFYTLLVILFGAVVRVTGSGAGCGQHWPTCNGEIVHLPRKLETLIEFSHRLTSGLSLVLVVLMVWWVRRRVPRQHLARKTSWLSLLFLVFEALLGAGLVLFELVAHNASLARAIVMPLHLTNTSLLMLCLTLTAWAVPKQDLSFAFGGPRSWLLLLGLAALLLVSATGAVTALGDTLYPVSAAGHWSLGVEQAGGAVTAIERMRSLHPLLALFVALYLFVVASYQTKPKHLSGWLVPSVIGALLLQLMLGVINIWLSAPGYMQILHLGMANAVWVLWVLLCAESLRSPASDRASERPAQPASSRIPSPGATTRSSGA